MPDCANPQSLNRYSYVVNNPLRYTDPTGHMMAVDGGGGTLDNTLKYFGKHGKHKDKFNEVYAAIYEAELALASVLSDGKLSEGESLELKTYEDETQQYRDIALKNLSQDEFADLKYSPSSLNLLKRATDRAEIVDGFVVSSQIPSEPDILGDSAAIAGIVVVFGHGARHLKGLPVTQAEVEAAISRSVELNVNPASSGLYKGYVTVNGIEFEYHAYPLGNNTINIGTYYPEKK